MRTNHSNFCAQVKQILIDCIRWNSYTDQIVVDIDNIKYALDKERLGWSTNNKDKPKLDFLAKIKAFGVESFVKLNISRYERSL